MAEIGRVSEINQNVNEMYSKISGLGNIPAKKSIDPNAERVTCKIGQNQSS